MARRARVVEVSEVACRCPRPERITDAERHAQWHELVVEQGGPAGLVDASTLRGARGLASADERRPARQLRGLEVDLDRALEAAEPLLPPAVKLQLDARDTSRDAAARHLPRSGTARHRVLDALGRARGAGATDEELQRHLAMPANTQRPRRVELVEAGYVRASGVIRQTAGGDRAIVWTITDAGRAVLAQLGPLPTEDA